MGLGLSRSRPQRDAVLQLAILDSGLHRLDAAPILQCCDRVGKLKGRMESWRTTNASNTGVFQQRHLVHELVLACSPRPSPRPQIKYTTLSQADWCAIRAVARCELGLLPVLQILHTAGTGARVFWWGRWCQRRGRTSCFCQGSKFLSATRAGVQMPWKRRRSSTADIVCGHMGRELGEPRCDEDNDEIALDAISFQPRFMVQELIFTHRPHQLRLRLSEFSWQSRLALR